MIRFISFWWLWVLVAVHKLSLVAVNRGYSQVAVRGLLNVVAFLLQSMVKSFSRRSSWALEYWLSSWDMWAQLHLIMGNPPRLGIQPMFSALAGRYPTTGPPGKASAQFLLGAGLVGILHLACTKVPDSRKKNRCSAGVTLFIQIV